MDQLQLTQLGVSGVIVLILLLIVKELWTKYQEALKQMREDQAAMLPALIQASQAMEEVGKVANRLADRERGL